MNRSGLPSILRRYWAWTIALAVLSLVYTAVMTRLTHSPKPYGSTLISGIDRWWDFMVFKDRFLLFRTPRFWTVVSFPFTYPAPSAVVFGLLFKLPHPLQLYLAACVAAGLAWVLWFAARLHAKGISWYVAGAFSLTIAATALPVWFLLSTANIEAVIAVVLGLGVIACARGRWWLGAALIGVAGAMKIFPLILLGLPLAMRRYRAFAGGLVVAGAVTLASLATLGPNVREANRHIGAGLVFIRDAFVLRAAPDGYIDNHSLFMPIKMVVAEIDRHRFPTPPKVDRGDRDRTALRRPYEAYLAFAAALGIALYFARIRKLPPLNQILALTVCAVMLPPISVDYTLLHLLVPFALLCLYAVDFHASGLHEKDRGEARGLRTCFICFALIFTLGSFFTVRLRLGSSVRVVALAVLLVAVLRYPFRTAESAAP